MRKTLQVLTVAAMLVVAAGSGDVWAAKPDRNTPPTVTSFDVPDDSSSPVPIMAFIASDSDGSVTGYLVTESAGQPDSGDPGWSATAPLDYSTYAVGAVTLYAWARDNDGDVSASLSDTVFIPDPLEARVFALEADVEDLKSKVSAICDLYELTGNFSVAPSYCQDTKTIFVSSLEYHGYLGSVADYDSECQSLAAAAGLSGTYLAWLSNGTSPATDFTHATSDYILVDGSVVANGWSDLTDGSLDHPINLTEGGSTPGGSSTAWTGTDWQGFGFSPPNTCEGWWDPGGIGVVGLWAATDTSWSEFTGYPCDLVVNHVYCFEQ